MAWTMWTRACTSSIRMSTSVFLFGGKAALQAALLKVVAEQFVLVVLPVLSISKYYHMGLNKNKRTRCRLKIKGDTLHLTFFGSGLSRAFGLIIAGETYLCGPTGKPALAMRSQHPQVRFPPRCIN